MVDVQAAWNIKGQLHRIHPSAWEVGDCVLKQGSAAALHRNALVLSQLRQMGVPAAEPIPSTTGEFVVEQSGKGYLLTRRLQGKHIEDIYQMDYRAVARYTGEIAAKMHQALHELEGELDIANVPFSQELQGWIFKVLAADGWELVPREAFDSSTAPLLASYDELPMQLIHRDLHFGNMLFEGEKLSGFIDFDLSKRDVRLFDLCYYLLSLLLDHDQDAGDDSAWYEMCGAFIEGYGAIEALRDRERESIPWLMESIEILFVAYFTKEGRVDLARDAACLYHFLQEHRKDISAAVG